MKVLGVIPARYGSTRFEGKALADILGKPMIQRVYERAIKARTIDELIVATDDIRIFDTVKGFGGNVTMTAQHNTGTDRIAEVAGKNDADIIVNVQGDEPLIEPTMIDEAVQPLIDDNSIDLGTLVHRISSDEEYHNPNVVKVAITKQGFAMYFSRSPIPYIKSGNIENTIVYRHVGLYVYRKYALLDFAAKPSTPFELSEGLEQLRFLENGYRMKVVETKYKSIGVDTPEDLENVKKMILAGY
ncbi:TPA: 3-deoxy-manno-octulosonate cytidylyltransferase [bacterium]|nr:3-deoxy-manno-octulosonate cytidylyltransferase [bacterium]